MSEGYLNSTSNDTSNDTTFQGGSTTEGKNFSTSDDNDESLPENQSLTEDLEISDDGDDS